MQKYKADLTKLVLDQLNNNIWTLESAMKDWWMTGAHRDGLRLTDVGDLSFREADFEFYEVEIKPVKLSYFQFITELNAKIKCPYYIYTNSDRKPKIRLYDSRIAMMVSLHGDLASYLDSIKKPR